MTKNKRIPVSRNSSIDSLHDTDYYGDGIPGTECEESSAEIDRLLTVQEVCELLRVKKSYVYWLTYQKRIPYIKMQGHLRFRKSVIDRWLDSQEVRNAS